MKEIPDVSSNRKFIIELVDDHDGRHTRLRAYDGKPFDALVAFALLLGGAAAVMVSLVGPDKQGQKLARKAALATIDQEFEAALTGWGDTSIPKEVSKFLAYLERD